MLKIYYLITILFIINICNAINIKKRKSCTTCFNSCEREVDIKCRNFKSEKKCCKAGYGSWVHNCESNCCGELSTNKNKIVNISNKNLNNKKLQKRCANYTEYLVCYGACWAAPDFLQSQCQSCCFDMFC